MTVGRCRGSRRRRSVRLVDRPDFRQVRGQSICSVRRDTCGTNARSDAQRHVRVRGGHRRRSRVARVLLHRVRGATVAADLRPLRVLWRAWAPVADHRPNADQSQCVPLSRRAGGAGGAVRLPRPARPQRRRTQSGPGQPRRCHRPRAASRPRQGLLRTHTDTP